MPEPLEKISAGNIQRFAVGTTEAEDELNVSLRKMSLNQICSDFSKKLELLDKFSEFESNEDRIKFTYDAFRNYFSGLNFKRSTKNNKTSQNLRNEAKVSLWKNKIWDAVRLSTQSLSYSEDNSSLRHAFMTRSDILVFLKQFHEASKDLLKAAELTDPQSDSEEFLVKLTEVLEKKSEPQCLTGRGDSAPLQGGNSNFFDSASVSVGLGYSDSCERQLVAKNDIKTGDVLIVEKPYASVLLSSHYYTHCSHCFSRNFNLEPCSKCCFAMFCSKQCENNSLESYHEIECNIIDLLVELKVERMELLSLRLLICASNQGKNLQKLYKDIQKWENNKNKNNNNNSQSYKSSDFVNIYHLVTNSDKRPASDLFYRCIVSSALVEILSQRTKFFADVPADEKQLYQLFSVGLLFRFMQSLPCNAHEISEFTDDGLNEIGAGIYATLSLVNHSCDPNVVRHSCGDVIVLRAIKPIKKNEQIFDNYGYHYATHSVNERKTALMKQYYFNCECEACTRLWPKYEQLPRDNVKFKENINRKAYTKLTEKFDTNLKNTINGDFTSQTVEDFSKYLDFLHEFVVLPWQNFNNCQEALKHCWCFNGNHFRHSKAVVPE